METRPEAIPTSLIMPLSTLLTCGPAPPVANYPNIILDLLLCRHTPKLMRMPSADAMEGQREYYTIAIALLHLESLLYHFHSTSDIDAPCVAIQISTRARY